MKKANFWKILLVVFLTHIIRDWKENVEAFKIGASGKPFSELSKISK
ncbi:MAG: hypothetical protein JWP67_3224 [Mucilaginibacter sp.]|nr:hypothetical protein [Mucilaginibacter sp.]MDB5287392.1 hypothetical protein [Mucilaginibacter sp.]